MVVSQQRPLSVLWTYLIRLKKSREFGIEVKDVFVSMDRIVKRKEKNCN